MPVTKSAKKKLRKDRARQKQNKRREDNLANAIKHAKKVKSQKAIILAVKAADTAAKRHIIHKNKAARIKASLSKLLPKGPAKKAKATKTKSKTKSASTTRKSRS